MKALGTGWRRGVRWRDIEVGRDPSGKHTLHLEGAARRIADQRGIHGNVVGLQVLDHLLDGRLAAILLAIRNHIDYPAAIRTYERAGFRVYEVREEEADPL